MILLKTPLAFLVLLGLAVAARREEPRPDRWTARVMVPFVAVVACFSLLATPNSASGIYFRACQR